MIEITAPDGYQDTLVAAAEKYGVLDLFVTPVSEDGRRLIRILAGSGDHQPLIDALQKVLAGSTEWRIALMPIEGAILSPEKESQEEDRKKEGGSVRIFGSSITREELHQELERGTRPDATFFVLTFLSTIVAAIGLLHDNIAVVIGAMVIAPLLGPNLAFAFASAIADRPLMAVAAKTNVLGLLLTLAISGVIGFFWPDDLSARELISRTEVSYGSIALALASGAAAVLSISTGLSTALVGVMVAVALLPPAATFGIMVGAGRFDLGAGALLLLAVNVICVNLAAQTVFAVKGLRPRTWFEQQSSRRMVGINIALWLTLLAVIAYVIGLRGGVPTL